MNPSLSLFITIYKQKQNISMSFNVLKQNKISSPGIGIFAFVNKCIFVLRLKYVQVDFLWQAQDLSVLNFVVLLNNSLSPYIQLKSTIRLTSIIQNALDESNRKLIVWKRWSVWTCLLWSVACKMWDGSFRKLKKWLLEEKIYV